MVKEDKEQEELFKALEKSIEELTLLLLYLNGWEEKGFEDKKTIRSWKGFRFEVLNDLEEKGLISQSRTAKSAYLTDKGHKRARQLYDKYLDLEENPLA